MAGRARPKVAIEEETRVGLRIPTRLLKKLDKHLETARPRLSRNAWIVEAVLREYERTIETEKKGK